MSADVAADLTRVVLIAPHQTMELALPTRVPLADLLPVLTQRAAAGHPRRSRRRSSRGRGRGKGLSGDGDWVLQRLGGAPLDEDQTLASIPVYDGETLYLRPRDSRLPPAHFDDLIDGLATGIQGRPDRWREPMTRGALLIACVAVLSICLVVLLRGPYPERTPMSAVVAMFLILGALVCARALGDSWGGMALGLSGTAFAVVAGLFALPEATGPALSTPRLLCGFGAAAVSSMSVMYVVGAHRPAFLALWLTAGVAAGGALMMVLGATAPQAAGATTVLVLAASTFAPTTAFRLARLRLPQLPTSASDLSDDIEPYSGPQILAGAALADTYLTWLSVGVGAVATVGMVVLGRDPEPPARWLVGAVSLVLVTRSRSVTSTWQRGALLLPAVLGTVLVAIPLADQPNPFARLMVTTLLLTAAGLFLALSHSMPGRRLLPYWGRFVDIGEYLAAAAAVLILFDLFGTYQWARALNG